MLFSAMRIHSRLGNIVIEVIGAIYALAATTLLVYYIVSVWDAATMIDRALQVFLLITIVAGVGFIAIGRDNLRRRRA